MASVYTDVGEDWLSEKALDSRQGESLYEIAVGSDSTSPSETDTALGNELYRANDDDSVASIETTSNRGEIRARITLTGGTEVSANQDLTEFGIFSSDGVMVYRETRAAVSLSEGERTTFEILLKVE